MRVPAVFLAVVFITTVAAAALLLLAPGAHATDIQIDGDWVVNEIREYEGDTITVRGNIDVRDGGSLTLRNSTLYMDSRQGDYFRITVHSSGSIAVYSSTITNRFTSENYHRYFFDVYSASVFKDSTISRLYGWNNDNQGGLRLLGGDHHVIEDCVITNSRTWGVLTRCPLTMTGTTVSATSWSRVAIYTQDRVEDMDWSFEGCTFYGSYNDPYSYGIYINDDYATPMRRYVNITNCDFQGVDYGVYIDPTWRNGLIEMTFNTFDRCTYGVRVASQSLNVTMHHNDYFVRGGGVGIWLYQGSYGHVDWHHEDIRGYSLGDGYGVQLRGGGSGRHDIRHVTVWNTYYGFDSDHGEAVIRDSYVNTTNNAFTVRGGATIDIYNTFHPIGSGFVETTGGRITAWQRLNVSSVKWSDGTTITQGMVYLLNGTDYRVGALNLSLGQRYLDFKRWEAMRAWMWNNVQVYPALLDVDTYFRARPLDYMATRPQDIVFTDDYTPRLTLDGLSDGSRVNVSYLIMEGDVIERGRGLANVEVSLDGENWESAAVTGERWDFAYGRLADGVYQLHIRAGDRAGNLANIDLKNIVIDTHAPWIDLDAEPPMATNQPMLTITGRTEAGATVYIGQVTATPDATGAFSITYPMSEGTNGLTLRVRDAAGNWNQTVFTVALDTVPPGLTVTEPRGGIITRENVVRVAGSTDADATLTIDGEQVSTYKGAFTHDLELTEGEHRIEIVASDAAGNERTAFRRVTVDITPPTLTIDKPEGLVTKTTDDRAYVSGSMDEDISWVLINGVNHTALPGEFALQVDLVEGKNEFLVVCRDLAGNDARVTVTIWRDNRPPKYEVEQEVTDGDIVKSGEDLFATGRTLAFHVNVDEPAVFKLGGQEHQGEGRFTITHQLTDGLNAITIEVADELGNLGTPYVYTITYDVTPPTVTITYPLDGATVTSTELVLKGVSDDVRAKVWINGIPLSVRSDGSFEMTVALEVGENEFKVEGKDRAGNEGSSSLTVVRKEKVEAEETSMAGLVGALVVGLLLGLAIMFVIARRQTAAEGGPRPLGPPSPPERGPPGPPEPPEGEERKGGWEEY